MVNYEKLCLEPRETLSRVFAHLGIVVSPALLDHAQGLIRPSRSIGAWRSSGVRLLHEPPAQTQEVLRRFGYETDGPQP